MKRKTRLLVMLTALAVVAFTACDVPNGPSDLENKTWVLESYGRQDSPQGVLDETEITAVFDGAEGEVSGSAGCNSYFGSYEASGSELSILALGYTEMYCVTPEGVMDQEQQYLTALTGAESYQVRDGQLHITCAGRRTLVFNAR